MNSSNGFVRVRENKVLSLSENNNGDVRNLLLSETEQRDVVQTRIGERIEFAKRDALRGSELVGHDAIKGNDAD